MKFFCGLLIFLLFASEQIAAQTQRVNFNLVTGTNGLSLGKINCIMRDKNGFLWLSDQSNRCIIRYDGSHMTRYQNDPKNPNSLGGYYPECLAADSSGIIWIGFYGMGLDRFDPVSNTFKHFSHQQNDPSSLSDDFVSAVLVDHPGNVWIGTNGGLDQLDQQTGKFKHYSHSDRDSTSLSYNIVRAIYEDKAGDLWVGTGFPFADDNLGGLNRFNRNNGSFTRYMNDPKNPNSLNGNKVRAIFEDSRGNFWIGTNGDGLHTMDRKTGLFTRLANNPAKPGQLSRPSLAGIIDHITFITEDTEKQIWIGSLLNGIVRYDPQTKKTVQFGNDADKESELKDRTSWWAHASPDGFVWFSTQNASLYKADIYNTVIERFDSDEGVRAFNEEAPAVFWIGTNNGLIRRDGKNGKTRRFVNEPGNPKSLSGNLVTAILKDNQGGLWIGTGKGLNQYNSKTESFTRFLYNNNGQLSSAVTRLCEDSDSNIWVGFYGGGLTKLNRKSGEFTHYQNDPADVNTLSTDIILAIHEDETKDLWIGNDNNGGINRMNRQTGKVTRYLPGLGITCIYRDAQGVIWVGTPSGLFRYDRRSDAFKSIGEESEGINIVQIASIVEDQKNNLWITAESGIYMLNKTRNQAIRFGRKTGIAEANNFFYNSSSFKRQDGELYFGTFAGYIAFFPDKLKSAPGGTQLYFTGFWLDNKEIVPGETGPLRQSLNKTKEIRLDYNQNVFSFGATFIDFRNAEDKQIFCKLENFDPDWHTSGAEERIHYFKVPPGKYIFKIKTANTTNGEWIEKSIAIVISPPWWNTWLAYGFYGLFFMGSVYSVHRFQKERVIKAERERTRAKELEQAKEIEKAYHDLKVTQSQLIQFEKMASLGELTAGIAHEIQNPLNFVNNFSEVNSELIAEMKQAVDKGNLDEAKTIANTIDENEQKIIFHGKRADTIVKGMLQHSRSSSGVKEPTNINALADEYLRLAYHGLRAKDKSFNASMKTDFDVSIGDINIIPQDIGRVILNLITNAFYTVTERKKRGEQGYEPTVSITTKKANGKVEIRVKDNGAGIPQKVLDKIFQPFFTTKPTGQGTGLGLSLSYDIVKAHGGELKVQTEEGEFAEFIVLLPQG